MPICSLLPLLMLAPCAPPPPDKAEKPDAAAIARLVAQLGSNDFEDREKASMELDAIGEAALDALRQAVKSTDTELRTRAEAVLGKIQNRLEPEITQRPKRVHLLLKDTSVKEAVEVFRKESGYDLVLRAANEKLKSRTVTLDTGDVTFWQAFAVFCEKAGLKESPVQDLVSLQKPYANSPAGPMIAVERITLIDGRPETGPTDSASAVCIRSVTPPVAEVKTESVPIALLLSLEPRLQWLSIGKVTVTKAIDDQKQNLTLITTDVTPANPTQMPPVITAGDDEFIGGGVYREAVMHLKKGPKPSRVLTELSGTVTAKILGEMSAIISAPNILEAGGKTFRGGEDGLLKVIDASKDINGRIIIRVEIHPPSGVVPLNGEGVPAGVAKGIAAIPDGLYLGPGLGWGSNNSSGLGLMDAKGNNIKPASGGPTVVRDEKTPVGVVAHVTHCLGFQAEKGQEPSTLVFCGRKILTVEIPFTLKDVPLP